MGVGVGWGVQTKPHPVKNLGIIFPPLPSSFPKNYSKISSFRVEFHEAPNP